jgi:phytoene dehydrogenase-like protein
MTSQSDSRSADVIVVGGGLAGLTAAAVAARAGKKVALFEKARDLGGRGATQNEGGFLFNIGPHALYRGGAASPILAELGVTYSGKSPSVSGGFAIDGGRKHALPGGLVSLITTSLFRLPAKLEVAKLLGGLGRFDPEPQQRRTVNEWLAQAIRHEDVRQLMRALVRLSTYANAPDRLSAGTAIRQLQLALGQSVIYLNGGWQTLVEGLRQAALGAGVRIHSGVKVEAVEGDGAARGVRIAGDDPWTAAAVVLTGGPAETSALVHDGAHLPLRRRVEEATAVRAACLDLGLASLPRPRATFALGVDEPLYLSVHSAVAKLGPDNSATIHVAKYLAPDDESDARATERQLEGAMDLIQPGWREVVRQRRFLPRMTVTHDLPTAAAGGLAGRATVEVSGIANLYIAGDWVGSDGMLADAALASGKRAGLLAAGAGRLSAAA